jgi:cytochrome c-type biogenesis protein CcmH/NrfF
MPEDFWGNAIFSVTPTILLGLIFWFAMRAIIRADRAERQTYSQIEAEERARLEKLGVDPHE